MKEVLKEYTQKSRIFLYPLLGIQRNISIVPIQTYMNWDNYCTIEDNKLLCLYHLRDDNEFKNFEKTKLSGNKLFCDFKFVDEDNKGVYVFDMNHLKVNWKNILLGRYSKLSPSHKNIIVNFFKNSPNLAHIESFLFPEKYFSLYAQLLNVNEKVLKEVGELCPRPDFEKEKLKLNIKNLDSISNPINL